LAYYLENSPEKIDYSSFSREFYQEISRLLLVLSLFETQGYLGALVLRFFSLAMQKGTKY